MAVACLWGNILPARVLAEDIPPAAVATCAAATPVPNPWTKKMPAGWWIKRHEEILTSETRGAAGIYRRLDYRWLGCRGKWVEHMGKKIPAAARLESRHCLR